MKNDILLKQNIYLHVNEWISNKNKNRISDEEIKMYDRL